MKKIKEDASARMCIYVLAGISVMLSIFVFCYGATASSCRAGLGGVLWGFALFVFGSLIGFLFGVPKSARNRLRGGALYVNTNLEDISDWLSKIIVGTGLVELKASPDYFRRLASLIAGTFVSRGSASLSVGGAITVAFPVLGFLIAYLVTRILLQPEFLLSDGLLKKIELLDQKVQTTQQKVEATEKGVQQAKNLAKVAMGVNPTGLTPDATVAQALAIWNSDPHKGKFGGSAANNGRELLATITPVLAGESTCKLRLEVRSTAAARPLTGPVTFFLHPTFELDQVGVPVNDQGVATYDTLAESPFTVGATVDEGGTQLELDLDGVSGGTPEFYANA